MFVVGLCEGFCFGFESCVEGYFGFFFDVEFVLCFEFEGLVEPLAGVVQLGRILGVVIGSAVELLGVGFVVHCTLLRVQA